MSLTPVFEHGYLRIGIARRVTRAISAAFAARYLRARVRVFHDTNVYVAT